jgi:hypothetical protein
MLSLHICHESATVKSETEYRICGGCSGNKKATVPSEVSEVPANHGCSAMVLRLELEVSSHWG